MLLRATTQTSLLPSELAHDHLRFLWSILPRPMIPAKPDSKHYMVSYAVIAVTISNRRDDGQWI